MSVKINNEKLFALWAHDLYPYVCGGPITKMNKSGSVETENYGKGFYFNPLLILPLEEGKELLSKLKVLEKEYDSAKKSLHKSFLKRIEDECPQIYKKIK